MVIVCDLVVMDHIARQRLDLGPVASVTGRLLAGCGDPLVLSAGNLTLASGRSLAVAVAPSAGWGGRPWYGQYRKKTMKSLGFFSDQSFHLPFQQ